MAAECDYSSAAFPKKSRTEERCKKDGIEGKLSTDTHPFVPSWYELKFEGEILSYFCRICLKTSSNRAYMRHHLKRHMGGRLYQCHTCEQTFSIHRLVLLHQRSHVRERYWRSFDYDSSDDCDGDDDDDESGEEFSFIDDEPGEKAKSVDDSFMDRTSQDLLKALRLTDDCTGNDGRKSGGNEDDYEGNRSQYSFPFICSDCSEELPSPDALITHILANNTEKGSSANNGRSRKKMAGSGKSSKNLHST